MATMLQETESHATANCPAAALAWDHVKAAKTRKMCEYEEDQECICAEGEDCWLV